MKKRDKKLLAVTLNDFKVAVNRATKKIDLEALKSLVLVQEIK